MASTRRAAKGLPAAPAEVDPTRVTQATLPSPRGEVRAWFKGGICYRVSVAGQVYGWGEGPDVWAAVLDNSFRPPDYGKHDMRSC